MRTGKIPAYLLLPLMIGFAVNANAAEISIKVTDEGDPVPMAEVFLVDSKTRIIINTNFTDETGLYQYSVGHGLYEITVSKEEFLDVTIDGIEMKNSNISQVVEIIPEAFGSDETVFKSQSDDCD